MLSRLTSWLKAGLLFGGILLCAKAFIFLDHLDKTVFAVKGEVAQVQTDLSTSLGKVNTVLDDGHKLIPAATDTVREATKTLDDSRPKLLAVIDSANGLFGAATDTVNFAKPKIGTALDRTNRFLLEADTGSAAIRKQELANAQTWDASGKQFLLFLGKLNGIADHTDSAVIHGDKILANGEKISNRLAQPVTTVKKIAGWTWNSALHYLGAK